MKKLKLICMALIAVVAMVSCGKEGPMGPQGPAGQDGNANVVSSTLTIRSGQWYWENDYWRVDIDYPAITADIDNYGAVLVYKSYGSTWRQLPLTYYYYDSEYDAYYGECFEVSSYVGGVSIFCKESDGSHLDAPATSDYKIVVIAASYYQSHPEVDYEDYEAVKAALQLAD